MNTEQLIQQEAERRYPASHIIADNEYVYYDREKFVESATFGASLNGWVSVDDRLPTEDDGDNRGYVEAWEGVVCCTGTLHILQRFPKGYTHWRKIVKP